MERRWVKKDGRMVREVRQEADEVQKILDANHAIATSPNFVGGTGSKNQRCVARVPVVQHAAWTHEWRLKGGLNGTGLTGPEYCLLRASQPDYSKFVTTPSGDTGLEREARKLAFGWEAANVPVLRKKKKGAAPQKNRQFKVVTNSDLSQ